MKKKTLFNIILIFFTITSCYLLLVAGHVLIKRAYNSTTSFNSEALRIERLRYINEDSLEIIKASQDGYNIVIPPVFFDFSKRIKLLQDLVTEYQFIPLGAQPNENVYYCNEGYGLIKYKSDRYGFRNPDSLWSIKSRPEILLIGDSFVHGACVDEDYTFRGQLSKKFPFTLNLGMSGSSPKLYSRTGEFFIEKLKPENVIVFFFANDNEGEYKTIFDKKFMDNPHHLLYNKEKKLKEFYNVANRITKYNLNSGEDEEITKKNIWSRLKDDFQLDFYKQFLFQSPQKSTNETIDTIIKKCIENSCNPYFVFLPTSMFWRPDTRQDDYRNKIKFYLKNKYSLEKNFFDATNIIKKNDEMFAPKGPHYSIKGYELISLEILKMLKD